MANFILLSAINALRAVLAFERTYAKGKVFLEDEKQIVEWCIDLLVRIRGRSVGVFGETLEDGE